MQHDEFMGLVQDRAKLPSRGDAEAATRATLETLGERIPEMLAGNLAGQLPEEIGEHLRRTVTMGGAGSGERFDRDEFIARVAQRDRTDEPAATYRARVVFEVLREATTGGVVDKVRGSLPDDLRSLVDAGSSGQLD
ncbi:DUF2267 domain-containing protein [Actinophytocola gossypii]|uniref:DUF2267 domain-containing protein n=1 Tax=Actinophytocola gossypii TaxID=2812003 RepID=A0ABT2J405_9PSEU|nr:DUF2267 domain-containing protein [Actinophytocola gossypii]MCT2582319.1 DUF2267 domain-containing protein [Actinophytocola gossypii]